MSAPADLGHAIAAARRVPFRIGLRYPVRGWRYRQGWLILGPHGWGEFSPLPGASREEMTRCLQAAWETAAVAPPTGRRDEIETNALVPETDPATAHALTVASGCRTAKVKIGPGPDDPEDRARLEAVRAALGPTGKLRIDVNGAWDVGTAASWVRRNRDLDIELIEQPVAGLSDLAKLRAMIDVPVAADEAVRGVDDARLLRRLRAADAVVIKLQPAGGFAAALSIIEEAGVPAIVSSPIETAVGTMASARFAAALDDLPFPCGLASGQLLEDDVAKVRFHDGKLSLTDLTVDEDALVRVRL